VLELSQSLHEDAVWVCKHSKKRPACVPEGVDGEQLVSALRHGSGAKHVPDEVVQTTERCSDAQVWGGECCKVHWLDLLEYALVKEKANGISGDQTA